MTENVKSWFHEWLVKKQKDPNYDVRNSGPKHRQRFLCEVRVQGFNYVGIGNSTNKKDAQANSAKDFVQFLIRSGEIQRADCPDIYKTVMGESTETDAENNISKSIKVETENNISDLTNDRAEELLFSGNLTQVKSENKGDLPDVDVKPMCNLMDDDNTGNLIATDFENNLCEPTEPETENMGDLTETETENMGDLTETETENMGDLTDADTEYIDYLTADFENLGDITKYQDITETNVEKERSDKDAENAFKARSYQLELFECAKRKNSILVLGTGSGKTFISILLIKEFAHEIRGSLSSGAKRTVFVVNTVPLVYQQAAAIEKHTDLSVGKYEGSMNVDFWSTEKWHKELEKHEVLVIISKILHDLILHNHLPLSMINLMILDECHHATGNHPMREVMREYHRFRCLNKIAPRILGLTACVIHKKVKPNQVESAMRELEMALNSSLETSHDQDMVKEYTTRPKEIVIMYDEPKHFTKYQQNITTQLNDIIKIIAKRKGLAEKPKKNMMKILNNIVYITEELGDWCVGRAIKYEIEDFQNKMDNEDVPTTRDLLKDIKERLQTIYQKCHDEEKSMNPEADTNPKIKRFLDILRACRNSEILGLVFVQRRSTAKILYDMLLKISEQGESDLSWVKPRYVVGANCSTGVDIHLPELEVLKHKITLEEFRQGDCNIIVTTSVLEEGVDVRKCNIVLRFDNPLNFRAYVQARGRARAIPSKYIWLCATAGLSKELQDIHVYRTIEKVLHKLCHEREPPSEGEIREHFAIDEVIRPYAPYGINGPKVTMNSAVALVDRYCGKLPQEKFNLLAPEVKYDIGESEIDIKIAAGIKLPLNAPVRTTIYGDEMESKELARKSAAVAVCRKLHNIGELDHRLLPIKRTSEDLLNELVDLQEDDIGKGSSQSGKRKRKQLYKREVCKAFSNKANEDHYIMYYICITQTEIPTDGVILDSSKNKLGLLCKGELQHCPFPLFSPKWGEVSVSIEKIKLTTPSLDTLTKIYHFHKLVIQNLVSENSVLEFNPKLSGNCVYIVPLTQAKEIDQKTLSRVTTMQTLWLPQKNNSAVEYQFDRSRFVDAIVMPSYRKKEIYYVAKIVDAMNPLSEFPEKKKSYNTYEEYYFKVYLGRISNKTQPLMEVKHIPREMNYLRRIPTAAKNIRIEPPRIIPELTLLFGLPASFWMQIMCMPSVLHRLNAINVSAELAIKFSSEIETIINTTVNEEDTDTGQAESKKLKTC